MNPLRYARTAIHKKSETVHMGRGVPRLSELTDGVPVFRTTSDGLVQYVRVKNIIYKNVFYILNSDVFLIIFL